MYLSETFKIGNTTKTHGVEGGIVLLMDVKPIPDFEFPRWIFLYIDHGLVPFNLLEYQYISEKKAILFVKYIDSPELARKYLNCQVFLSNEFKSSFEGASSYDYLLSYTLVHNDQTIGIIEELIENPGNSLFLLNGNGKEILLPAHPDFILDIDHSKKIIYYDLPDGYDLFL